MKMPQLSPAQVQEIATLVANYVRTQRETFVGRASPLPPDLAVQMNGFFRPQLLNSTRAVVLNDERVASPDFYSVLQGLGFNNLPDFGGMAAITFRDVIVSHEPFSPTLLFHELVHVEQYDQLGVDRFAELYVKGFLTSGSYEAIPLELNAYGLEATFRNSPHLRFSVESEVTAFLRSALSLFPSFPTLSPKREPNFSALFPTSCSNARRWLCY